MDRKTAVAVVALVLANALLLGAFHDRSWIPADDGHYVHVADRVLAGQVLNRDVSEHHPGYVNFVHAAALAVFGRELASLRLPLLALTFLQSLLVFAVLRPRGTGVAWVAALAPTCIGFLQMANPAAGFYALFCSVACAAVLTLLPPGHRGRVAWVGLLVGLAFLFRQPSGLFVGMGALAFLLLEAEGEPGAGPPWLARALLAAMALFLSTFLALTSERVGLLLFGGWPLLVLFYGLRLVRASKTQTLRILGQLSLGAAASALPLVAYHAAHGSLADWWSDCFLRALAVPRLEFLDDGSFGWTLLAGLRGVLAGEGLTERLNGLYWLALPLLSAANGLCLARALRSGRAGLAGAALPTVAVFHALVSDMNQIATYLYLSAGLSLAALLGWSRGRGRLAVVPLGLLLCGVGVAFHAGQPYTRPLGEVYAGSQRTLVESGLARSGLRVDPEEERLYTALVDAIQRRSRPGQAIFVTPNNAALYFLAERSNPFRLFNPTLGLLDEAEVDAFARVLLRHEPALLVHDTADKYNTPLTERLMRQLRSHYQPVETLGSFQLYAPAITAGG